MTAVLREALPLLGSHRNSKDLPLLERMLDHEEEYVVSGAVAALYRFHAYHETAREPSELIEKSGWDSLTAAEKHVLAIRELDGEVNNGGFSQYYFNSSGNDWQDALDGLAAIGAEARHRIMLATTEKFGRKPPSANRKKRNAQLARLVPDEDEDPFYDEGQAWYAVKDENLERLIYKYNMATLEGRRKGEGT
jgi:hypothetical protein